MCVPLLCAPLLPSQHVGLGGTHPWDTEPPTVVWGSRSLRAVAPRPGEVGLPPMQPGRGSGGGMLGNPTEQECPLEDGGIKIALQVVLFPDEKDRRHHLPTLGTVRS